MRHFICRQFLRLEEFPLIERAFPSILKDVASKIEPTVFLSYIFTSLALGFSECKKCTQATKEKSVNRLCGGEEGSIFTENFITKDESRKILWILTFFFKREEADEYISIGALNGLFVLGRSIGFIGK